MTPSSLGLGDCQTLIFLIHVFFNELSPILGITAIGSPEFDTKEYLLPQMNSLSKRKIIKNFQPIDISENYKYWSSLILNECNNGNTNCLFVDQPTAYKEEISEELKKRLWMTPPNHEYTLNLEDLTIISCIQ